MGTKAILGNPMWRGNSDAMVDGRMDDDLIAAVADGSVTAGMAVSKTQISNRTIFSKFDGVNFGGFLCAVDLGGCGNTATTIMHGLGVVVANPNAIGDGLAVGIDATGTLVAAADAVFVFNGSTTGQVDEAIGHLSISIGAGVRMDFTGGQVKASAVAAEAEPVKRTRR